MAGLRLYSCDIFRILALKKKPYVGSQGIFLRDFSHFGIEKNDNMPGLRLYSCEIFQSLALKTQHLPGF